ncbi:MAG: prepilin peptidase [Frankia sp.]|nr:prepilin peptidase [Frankia sp.]
MILPLVVGVAALGLLIGSFINVVVWRVPRGESVVAPRSRCPQCGHTIRGRDNVPVASWVMLHGRCRDCGARISSRYPLVELLTGVLFAALALRFAPGRSAADGIRVLPAFLYLGAVSVALTAIDIDVKRLPNALTLPSYAVGALLLAGAAASGAGFAPLVRAGEGMLALYAVYFALAFAYPAGMGFGDVKLAGVLGLYLGWLGWGEWGVGVLAGFFAGGIFGAALMAARRASRKTAVPFGPFMVLGTFVAVLVGRPIARVWLGI